MRVVLPLLLLASSSTATVPSPDLQFVGRARIEVKSLLERTYEGERVRIKLRPQKTPGRWQIEYRRANNLCLLDAVGSRERMVITKGQSCRIRYRDPKTRVTADVTVLAGTLELRKDRRHHLQLQASIAGDVSVFEERVIFGQRLGGWIPLPQTAGVGWYEGATPAG